jgi:hypothetical protein
MYDVLWRERRYLTIEFDEVIGENFHEGFPFFFSKPEHGF